MSEWREVMLEDVADEITVGYVGPMTSEYVDNGIPFLRSLNVRPLRIEKNDIKYISPEFHQRIRKSRLTTGDVVIVRTGTPGACALIPEWLPDANCSDLVIVRCGQEIDNRFLVYYVNTVASSHIAAHLVGAVQQHFNVGSARSLKINLPPLPEQRAIADVLSSLDDKIDLLHRQNKTLEAMAETLFRQWFVEEAGADWEEGVLQQYVDIGIGRTPPRNQHQWFSSSPEDVKWISIKDLGSEGIYVFKTAECLTHEAVEQFNIPVIPSDTVILSFKMTVGRVAITTEPMLSNEAIAHFKFRATTPFSVAYLYLYLKTYKYETLGSTSSIVTSINSAMIKEMSIPIPDTASMSHFDGITKDLFQKIRSNLGQIRTLEALRDTLLPKLMSGEVRVSAP